MKSDCFVNVNKNTSLWVCKGQIYIDSFFKLKGNSKKWSKHLCNKWNIFYTFRVLLICNIAACRIIFLYILLFINPLAHTSETREKIFIIAPRYSITHAIKMHKSERVPRFEHVWAQQTVVNFTQIAPVPCSVRTGL